MCTHYSVPERGLLLPSPSVSDVRLLHTVGYVVYCPGGGGSGQQHIVGAKLCTFRMVLAQKDFVFQFVLICSGHLSTCAEVRGQA